MKSEYELSIDISEPFDFNKSNLKTIENNQWFRI